MTPTITKSTETAPDQPAEIAGKLARALDMPPALAELLYRRGLSSTTDARAFLYPNFADLPAPGLLKGIDKAVSVIVNAVENDIPVVIHGDYDVDGVTATVLFLRFFRQIGVRCAYYIPNRLEDSYGLSLESVEKIDKLAEGEKRVLITVDCGITAVEAVDHARKLGFEVVVTDHHQAPLLLPEAQAVVNPKQAGCRFPFKELSGVGVAFFTVAAVRRALIDSGRLYGHQERTSSLKQYLDLVSLGTIADVMPLVETNRILVRAGLEVMNENRSLGLKALCRKSGIHDRDKISPETVSFAIAPRLNAAGRMGRADKAVELLLTDNQKEAEQFAEQLDQLNIRRKNLEGEILDSVFSLCSEQVEKGANALAVFHGDCHTGILGIVASRVVDRFKRPAIILTQDKTDAEGQQLLKGSGRSIEGVNLYAKLGECEQHIKQFGGHKMAVGLTLSLDEFEGFQTAFDASCSHIEAGIGNGAPIPDLHMDDKQFLTERFMAKMQFLQPFGEGNPEPLFLLKGEELRQAKTIREHLKFSLTTTGNKTISGIGFYLAEKLETVTDGPVDIIFKFKRSYFRGTRRLEVQAIDIAPSPK